MAGKSADADSLLGEMTLGSTRQEVRRPLRAFRDMKKAFTVFPIFSIGLVITLGLAPQEAGPALLVLLVIVGNGLVEVAPHFFTE